MERPETTKVLQQGEASTVSTGEWTHPESSEAAMPAYNPEASEAGIPILPEEFQAHVQSAQVIENQEFSPSRVVACIRKVYEFSYTNIFWVVYYAIITSSAITSLSLAVLLDAPASWAAYAILEVSIVGFVAPLIVKCLGWISYGFSCRSLPRSPSSSEGKPRMSERRLNAGKRAMDSPELQAQESSTGDTTYSSSSPQIVVVSADVHPEHVKSKYPPAAGEGGTCEVVPFGTSGGSTAQS